jgi:hypothetical protein
VIRGLAANGDVLSEWYSPYGTTDELLGQYMHNTWDLTGVVKVVAWAYDGRELLDDNAYRTQLSQEQV